MKKSNETPRTITPDKRKELAEWLEEQQVDINTIHRDCTDCVLVAKILKKIYPRMIDLYNYPARNTIKLKLANWTTLNAKVLHKLGLPQKPVTLHKCVNADRDAIEFLLYNIMRLNKATAKKPDENIENAVDDTHYEYSEKDAVVLNVSKVVGEETVKVPQKMIPYQAYEQAVNQFKDDAIRLMMAEEKVKELEVVLKQRTDEIDELVSQLARQTVLTMDAQNENKENSENSENMDSVDDLIEGTSIDNDITLDAGGIIDV